MCTVSFMPIKGGFMLHSNRDERLIRAQTIPPQPYEEEQVKLFFPRDQESSGTWIACSSTGKTYCLLNGAFEPHQPRPAYRKSRGLILLDIIRSPNPERYLEMESLTGIEPFTLVMIDELNGLQLQELRWDGEKYWLTNLDPSHPKIWSSVTLYDKEIRASREKWFFEWLLQNPAPAQTDLLDFHRQGGDGSRENNLVMKRDNDRQTISITSVVSHAGKREMQYEDLIHGNSHSIQIH